MQLRGGTYQLSKTVVFSLEDFGSEKAKITYAADPDEKPIFSSGKEIKKWEKLTTAPAGLPKSAIGKVWVTDISDHFRTLYDDKGLLPRARSEGFIPLEGGDKNELRFPKGRLKNWSNLQDVEIVVRPHHAWIVNILPLVTVDENQQVARTGIDASYKMVHLHFLKTTNSCWVENVLDALDEPGEWVLNTKEKNSTSGHATTKHRPRCYLRNSKNLSV